MNANNLTQTDIIDASAPLQTPFTLSHEHLIELLEAGKLNIWQWDLTTGNITDFGYSESLAKLAGFQSGPENIDCFLSRLHPDDRDTVQEALKQSFNTFQDYSAEYRIQLLTNEYAWVSANGRYTHNSNGAAVKMIGTWRFINDEKNIQKLLRDQQQTLSRLSRSFFVGELASTLAHELSQPLLVITTYLNGILRQLKTQNIDKDKLIHVLEIATNQVIKSKNIIKQIKSFIMHGELNYKKVNFITIINEAINLTSFSSHHFPIVEYQIQKNLPEIYCDENQIKHVFYNLIINSIEAMQTNDTIESKLIINVVYDNATLIVKLTDNGHGISDEALNNLFIPFFSSKVNGMGIGLSICRNIIESHGGQISIERTITQSGTICTFTIPNNHEVTNVAS